MNILRKIVILADVVIFGWIIWLGADEGLRGSDWVPFLGALLLIVLNICFLIMDKHDNNWVGLFLKRKALEEKKKIEELETKR